MKKAISVLIFTLMILAVLPISAMDAEAASIVDSGSCGANLTWTLDSDGLLTISGTGKMYDWDPNISGYFPPWLSSLNYNSDDIKKVVIKSGVTSIGECAFAYCDSLTNITIPNSVNYIGYASFYFCTSLTNITIPSGISSIEFNTFGNCKALKSVTIPSSVTYIGNSAFTCNNLQNVYYQGTQSQWKNIDIGPDNYDLTSATIHFVAPTLKITSQPKTTYAKLGASAKVTVAASGEGLKYAWYFKNPGASSFTKSGMTSSAYSVTMQNAISGRQVYCVVTDKYGNTVKSNTVTLYMAASISTQPKTSYTKLNSTAKATVAANGNGLSYAWYFKNPGSSSYTKSSITSSAYSMTMQQSLSGRKVYCIVTDKGGNSVRSDTVTLYLAATITKQPTGTTVSVGKTAKVSITAAGDALTYTWYFKNPGKSSFTKSGVTSSTYSMTMQQSLSGRQVYCVVTDKYGKTDKSNTVTLSAAAAVKITTQPKTTYTKVGASAKLTVAASGEGLKYTWYFKNPTASEFTKSGITSSTYSATMQKSLSGRQVYCVVTDKYGNSVKSNTVYLYLSASITKQPTDTTAAVGEKAKISVTAAGDGLTYTWYFKNPTASEFTKSGITSSTYSMTMQKSLSGRQVYCVVTDKYGKTVTSDTVTITAQ